MGIKNKTIGSGSLVDGIKCTYILLGGGAYEGNWIGNRGGGISMFTLEDDEILYRVVGRTHGTYLDQLELYTRRGNTTSERYGPYGYGGGSTSEFSGIIMGFHGYSQDYRQYSPPSVAPVCSRIGVYTLN